MEEDPTLTKLASAVKEQQRKEALVTAQAAMEQWTIHRAESVEDADFTVPAGQQSRVVFADNMDLSLGMPTLPDEGVALTFTSPPYWNFIEYGGAGVGYENSYEDYVSSLQHVFAEVYRKTMPGGRFVINVSNMKARQSIEGQAFIYPIVADTIRAMGKAGFTFFDEIIWHKKRGKAGALEDSPLWGSYPYPPTPKILDSTFENILVFTKPGQREVDLGIKEQSRLTLDEWREYTKGIWRIESGSEAIHPATFPMEVAERIVRLYSFVGDLVLDPFAGTGTTIVSAEKNLRAGVGYEITPIYQEAVRHKAEQWLENATECRLQAAGDLPGNPV